MTYLNLKSQHGVETIDYLDRLDFESGKAFKQELKRLINEYRAIGVFVYISQRATKNFGAK